MTGIRPYGSEEFGFGHSRSVLRITSLAIL